MHVRVSTLPFGGEQDRGQNRAELELAKQLPCQRAVPKGCGPSRGEAVTLGSWVPVPAGQGQSPSPERWRLPG